MRGMTDETPIAGFSALGPWFVIAVLLVPGAASERANGADEAAQSSTQADADGIEFFEKHIRPLFHEHCLECHAASGKGREADLALDSSAGIKAGGSRGPLYVAGDPDASLLLRAVRYDDA